jgi:hypothetical protein
MTFKDSLLCVLKCGLLLVTLKNYLFISGLISKMWVQILSNSSWEPGIIQMQMASDLTWP